MERWEVDSYNSTTIFLPSRYSTTRAPQIDGAARVLDPVFTGIAQRTYSAGVLLKDYAVSEW